MNARILDGKLVAQHIKEDLKRKIATFPTRFWLWVCQVGDDPASDVYIAGKRKACAEVGIESDLRKFPADTPQREVIKWIAEINKEGPHVGILIQLPLPSHYDRNYVLECMNPYKDVDCFHPINQGLLLSGSPRFIPCTPAGIVEILKFYKIPIKGANVVIINRSIVVGQPLALLLSQNTEHGNATVTLCHEYTRNIEEICLKADIIVTAVGNRPELGREKPFLLKADMVREGAVVVDVGISRVGKKIFGDVDFDEVSKKASWITPVPGGVGPCTVAMLLKNTVQAYERLKL